MTLSVEEIVEILAIEQLQQRGWDYILSLQLSQLHSDERASIKDVVQKTIEKSSQANQPVDQLVQPLFSGS